MLSRLRCSGPALVLAVVGALLVALPSGCKRSGDAGGFSQEAVAVESPAMEVSVRDLTVTQAPGRQDWSFTLVCEEAGGCRGTLRLQVDFRSRGQERAIASMREVDVPRGGKVRIGRSGPLEQVDRVERIRVELVRRQTVGPTPAPGQPRATPRS